MEKYIRYLFAVVFVIFSFFYINKVIDISEHNNVILDSISKYASVNDYDCREGSINEDGIILGLNGLMVDKNKSYSNMKGVGFKQDLVEYKKDKCILNKDDNKDKYIIKGNDYSNNISIVIDIDNSKYFMKMLNIASSKDIELNLLFNYNSLKENIDKDFNHNNILFKGKSKEELNSFIDILNDEIYCVKNSSYDVIDFCKNKKINSIKVINYINKDLLLNTKDILQNGTIIFISENETNLTELSSTINYIISRGYKIVNINELLN